MADYEGIESGKVIKAVDMVNALDRKIEKSGDTMTGDLKAKAGQTAKVVKDSMRYATEAQVYNFFPVGTVIMYKGTDWKDSDQTNPTLPGWYACNAANAAKTSLNPRVPNLTDRFILGGTAGANGSASTHGYRLTSTGQLPAHTHNVNVIYNTHTHQSGYVTSLSTGTVNNVAGSTPSEYSATVTESPVGKDTPDNLPLPPYYTLIFIMRVS